jgi:hypothetical protein
MTDVEPREGEVQDTEAEPRSVNAETTSNPVEDAVLGAYTAAGDVMYPEIDPLRGALSGMPAGNTDEMPPGSDEIIAAMEAAAEEAVVVPEKVEKPTAGARAATWEVGTGAAAKSKEYQDVG